MFHDRKDAGEQLARKLDRYRNSDPVVLTIPKGGAQVGAEVAKYLNSEFSYLISRKLPFPDYTEGGFGAIAEDGTTYIIKDAALWLDRGTIERIKKEQIREIDRRIKVLRKGEPLPDIKSRTVILVDDGIAMGSTMMAAIRMCRKRNPERIVVAVPVAGRRTSLQIRNESDDYVVLEIPDDFRAVAQVYRNWYDVPDDEAIEIFETFRKKREKMVEETQADIHHDVVVIGTGAAGATVAHKCRSAGMDVAVVDNRSYGGTCAQRGCNPKKVLTGAVEIMEQARQMGDNGLKGSDGIGIDWQSLMRFKRTFTDPVPERFERKFSERGIRTYHATARFAGRSLLQIDGKKVHSRYIVLATGAKPAKLGIEGEEHVISSDRFLELESLPEKIVFIGGGYISFEFAHVAARAGSEVVILQRNSRALKEFDPDMVDILVEATEKIGIEIVTRSPVTEIEKTGERYLVRTDSGKVYACDLVVHGAGRVAALDELDLAQGNVEAGPAGVVVNKYMQSISNPGVYAAGDCNENGPKLIPTANLEAFAVADNITGGNRKTVDYTAIPAVVFTIPALASAGIDSRKVTKGHQVISHDRTDWYSSRQVNEKYAASKIIVDQESDRIVGAHILGHRAEEVINIFSMAMRKGITRQELKEMAWAYPSVCADIRYMIR
ncbi:FAD-dependent pyridine nucleotide-disulfide oxidoreductase [Methanosalsum zhilinae DSM 4017]|uniref:FAD-dependent pyridine nucleotide-disulfide oxidoreductase n=1 Tax=Methanosalsum zhilinae (strain DSM 4017 / NBRC 107636 / OCM 62 / WeN5) TaxID=679901 RepID=F7XPU6_METZD|nr:FAD-dependent oxidoreductase [Methanosalsum zhilinae]AEH61467.1 FAD-dependent pyridine nucleotide-disulfide oxidoreductase [Methanosalsum zhilinae DSM 4017]